VTNDNDDQVCVVWFLFKMRETRGNFFLI